MLFVQDGIFQIIQNHTEVQNIQQGDYVWINSRLDLPGQNDTDNHGFFVIGWGTILTCNDALALSTPSFYSTYAEAQSTIPNNPVVPYVVDFAGIRSTGRTQRPIPRPFYCSWHEQDGDDIVFGSFGHDADQDRHSWYFFTLPNMVTIDQDQIYASLQWQWMPSDGQPIVSIP